MTNALYLVYNRIAERQLPDKRRKGKSMEEMTKDEFKTIMEMVRMIIEGSKDKEEALKKIDSLTILKGSEKTE